MAECPSESKGYGCEERKRYRPCPCGWCLRSLYHEVENAKGEVLLEKDSLIEQRVTDKGQITFTADLPVDGKYYVKEIFAPDGFVTTEEVQEFTLNMPEKTRQK